VKERPALGCLFEIVETLVLTAVIFLGIQAFVAQPYKVDGESMQTSLLPDQYVLVDKLTPRWAPYSRGDVVVFNPPPGVQAGANPSPFIKRVIGLPGDEVELRDGAVYVNGTKLDEPYVFSDADGPQSSDPVAGGETRWLVPSGQLFVMGDHRQVSEDSRAFGPIDMSAVIGRAWLRYWPISSFGILQHPSYPTLLPALGGPAPSPLPSSAPEGSPAPS
jgi:signal peptidase I